MPNMSTAPLKYERFAWSGTASNFAAPLNSLDHPRSTPKSEMEFYQTKGGAESTPDMKGQPGNHSNPQSSASLDILFYPRLVCFVATDPRARAVSYLRAL